MTTGDKPISLTDTATGETVDFSVVEFLKLAYSSEYRQTLCKFLGDISTPKRFNDALSQASPETLAAQVGPIQAVIERNNLAIKKVLLGKWQLYDASLDDPHPCTRREWLLGAAKGAAIIASVGSAAYAARNIKEPTTKDGIKPPASVMQPVSQDGTVIIPSPACAAAQTP